MIESWVWVGLALVIPWAARRLRPRVETSVGDAWPEAAWMARAAYGVLLPFAAWVRGAVVGRDLGLQAPWAREMWAATGVVAGALLVGEWLLPRWAGRARLRAAIGRERSLTDLFDTPRWALYRGAAWAWTGAAALGALIGFVLGTVELMMGGESPFGAGRPRFLWLTATMLVLALTGNLWLTLAAQAGALWLTRVDRA